MIKAVKRLQKQGLGSYEISKKLGLTNEKVRPVYESIVQEIIVARHKKIDKCFHKAISRARKWK